MWFDFVYYQCQDNYEKKKNKRFAHFIQTYSSRDCIYNLKST